MRASIVYNEGGIVAINKPGGIPSVRDRTSEPSVKDWLEEVLGQELFPINRIDRPVSGLILFASSPEVHRSIQTMWRDKVSKTYLAIVEGKFPHNRIELRNKLKKGRGNKAIIHKNGKESHLIVSEAIPLDRYSCLKINLGSGRFHQIRAQLSHYGYPIKGDVKYGARRKNKDRAIHLHSYSLVIPGHQEIVCPPPDRDTLWHEFSIQLHL